MADMYGCVCEDIKWIFKCVYTEMRKSLHGGKIPACSGINPGQGSVLSYMLLSGVFLYRHTDVYICMYYVYMDTRMHIKECCVCVYIYR